MRYLLFGGTHSAYPKGGWWDYVASFATADEANNEADKRNFQWWQVIDRLSLQIISEHEP